MNVVLAGAIVVAGIALLPVWRPIDAGLQAPAGVVGNAPPGITAALRDVERPGDRLFNPQPWGSWFEFTFPHLPVAIDSRIEVFPVEVWDQYERVVAGVDGWQDQLDDWGVTIVVAAGDGQDAFSARLVERRLARGVPGRGRRRPRPARPADPRDGRPRREYRAAPDLRVAVRARTRLLESDA